MQQVEAATAPNMPPAAIHLVLVVSSLVATLFALIDDVSFIVLLACRLLARILLLFEFLLLFESIDVIMGPVVTTDTSDIFMSSITKKRCYAIGELSKITGVNIETIRYYERIRVMPKPDRTSGGNRQYNFDELKRLSFIKRCRGLGFNLAETRALLSMVDQHNFSCAEVHEMTIKHLKTIESKLVDLNNLKKSLSTMASDCNNGNLPDCPIIDSLFNLDDG